MVEEAELYLLSDHEEAKAALVSSLSRRITDGSLSIVDLVRSRALVWWLCLYVDVVWQLVTH